MDTAGYLPDNILTKVDRASMAVSLEVRVPILDHRIVEFSYRLPPAMKAGALGAKRILKGVLGRHVPHNLFERPKQGFAGPVRFWLKGPLREWAADLISKEVVSRLAVKDPVTAKSALLRLRTGQIRVRDFRLIALARRGAVDGGGPVLIELKAPGADRWAGHRDFAAWAVREGGVSRSDRSAIARAAAAGVDHAVDRIGKEPGPDPHDALAPVRTGCDSRQPWTRQEPPHPHVAAVAAVEGSHVR